MTLKEAAEKIAAMTLEEILVKTEHFKNLPGAARCNICPMAQLVESMVGERVFVTSGANVYLDSQVGTDEIPRHLRRHLGSGAHRAIIVFDRALC